MLLWWFDDRVHLVISVSTIFEGITVKEETLVMSEMISLHPQPEHHLKSLQWWDFSQGQQCWTPEAVPLTWPLRIVTQFFHLSWTWLWVFAMEHLQLNSYQYLSFKSKEIGVLFLLTSYKVGNLRNYLNDVLLQPLHSTAIIGKCIWAGTENQCVKASAAQAWNLSSIPGTTMKEENFPSFTCHPLTSPCTLWHACTYTHVHHVHTRIDQTLWKNILSKEIVNNTSINSVLNSFA